MVRRKAVSSATRLCGASSTRYRYTQGRGPWTLENLDEDSGRTKTISEEKLYDSLVQRDERSVVASIK
eukprot:6805656-Prymnesium_polylepis.1